MVWILIIFIFLIGCESNFFPNREEIDQYEMVQLMTIDKCMKTGLVEITVINKTGKESGSKGGGSKETVNVFSGIGKTAFEAVRSLKSHSDKVIHFSHLEYFIFGEAAAAEDFGKYFDEISRDAELRLTPKVYIAKGCLAKDLIRDTVSSDKYIVDRLKNMGDDERVLGITSETSIIEVMNMLNTPNVAVVIPALGKKEIHDEISTGSLPEFDVVTAGYAMIKNFKLCGYIDATMSRGHNFIVNKVKSTSVSVMDFTGEFVGLEVINAKTKVKGHFKGKRLTGVTIETVVDSSLEEQHSRANIITKESLADLSVEQEKIISDEMKKVIQLSQEMEIDCIDIGKRIRMRYPFKWDDMKKEWDEIYPKLDIKVYVIANVSRSYDINQPNGYEME